MENEIIAVIDTATPTLLVGLIVGNHATARTTNDSRRADRLLDELANILTASALTKNQLTAIWVRTGLGSYTGLRVGVGVATALGWSLHIPVAGLTQTASKPIDLQNLIEQPPVIEPIIAPDAWPQLIPTYQPWPAGRESGTIRPIA